MRYGIQFFLTFALVGCGHTGAPSTPQERLNEAAQKLSAATSEEERFYVLNDVAKESFEVGKFADANKFATELLTLVTKYDGNWNYGNAIHDAHLVLGRLALKDGKVDEAKQHLLEAGKSPGSPQMDSFGPNMSLARDLLDKGEKDIVLEYFTLCRKFWEMGEEDLDQWTKDVNAGRSPDFGANLVY